MAKQLLNVWRVQLREIAAAMSPEITAVPVIDWDAFSEAQRAVLEPYLEQLAIEGNAQGAQKLGIQPAKAVDVQVDWALVNQSAVDWARAYTYDLVSEITTTTRTGLQDALSAWLESGQPFSELQAQVEHIFDDPQRAELIAVTEGTRAVNEGNAQTWEVVGVWGSEWRTANDELVCPICRALNRQRRPLGEKFTVKVGGRVISILRPPAHPGCRGTLVPVLRQPKNWKAPDAD